MSNYFAPNLTHLEMHRSDVNMIFDCLDVVHLPKLSHFKIPGHFEDHIWKMFQNCHRSHEGITSLKIMPLHSDVRDVQAIANIVKCFPSVTEFEMILKCLTNNFELLREMLNSFRDWRLAKGKIVIYGVVCLDALTAVLEGLAGWRGTVFF